MDCCREINLHEMGPPKMCWCFLLPFQSGACKQRMHLLKPQMEVARSQLGAQNKVLPCLQDCRPSHIGARTAECLCTAEQRRKWPRPCEAQEAAARAESADMYRAGP